MRSLFCLLLCLIGLFIGTEHAMAQEKDLTPEDIFNDMKWRPIGPANMGGRVTDIVGIPGDPSTFYFGGADGGVFKTTNGGTTFEALFTKQNAYSVGALAVADSDPNVIWLGTGEGDPRNSVGYGKGVFRSLDGGNNWTFVGLENTERIKRIVVHPNDPDVACVCALGREWGPNEERGVFRTENGGESWEKVLYLNENTGCSDIAMEWDNPRVIYAGMWTFRRKPWRFDDGGGETALYRSRDGGKTWDKIGKDLPEGPMARIGVAIAQSQPNIVYLITEIKDGGTLFRSEDRGDSWKMVNDDPNINFRPFYYSDIRVDPSDPQVVYSLSGRLSKSIDGGKTFSRIARGVHGDHQSLWIDPHNGNRVLSGSDGGYQVSFDGGKTFRILNNVELSQFYQMTVDNRDPYMIYGGLQDNGTWVGPSNSLYRTGILKRHWKKLAGGDGYYAEPIPGNEDEVYANLQGGVIFHVDSRTGNVRNIHPYPNKIGSAGDAIEQHKYRFNWDSPILISPHDPGTVYFGGNVVFKTTDKGNSWEVISPDLTTNDKSKQATSGGQIYQDNTAAEFHCSLLTLAESPLEKGVIWAGTDDGNVQLTRDGGKTWTNLKDRISGLPANAWVAKIHASTHDAGTAFIAVDQHRSDDFRPYAFMTEDYGKTWKNIVGSLPSKDYVKVIRQDPHNPKMYYAGMEHGIYVTWDGGEDWIRLNINMPPASVRDLRVQARERDLIAATHGRGIWVLDDIEALEGLRTVIKKDAHLFPPRRATRWHMYSQLENMADGAYKAKNPEYGAYINYFLHDDPTGEVKVEIKDANGTLVRSLVDSSAAAGINRLVWDLRIEGATPLDHPISGGWRSGPFRPKAAPGTYSVTLFAQGKTFEEKVEVRADPRLQATPEDYDQQSNALLQLRSLLSKIHEMINQSEQLNKQLADLQEKLKSAGLAEKQGTLMAKIEALMEESERMRFELRRPPPHMPYRQRPRLRGEIRSLMYAIDGATARPTRQQLARIEELKAETSAAVGHFEIMIKEDIAEINRLVKDLPQVVIGGE